MRGRAVDRMNGSAARLLHVRMAEPCGGVRAARRWPNCMMETNRAACAQADAALVGYVSVAKQAKSMRRVRGPMPHCSATCPARSRPNRAARARADAALVLRVRREAGQIHAMCARAGGADMRRPGGAGSDNGLSGRAELLWHRGCALCIAGDAAAVPAVLRAEAASPARPVSICKCASV